MNFKMIPHDIMGECLNRIYDENMDELITISNAGIFRWSIDNKSYDVIDDRLQIIGIDEL